MIYYTINLFIFVVIFIILKYNFLFIKICNDFLFLFKI